MTSDTDFKVMTFFKLISEKLRVLKTKLLLHKRKLYLTYGMVLCLVTLTDLSTPRAGLSTSAELLVVLTAENSVDTRMNCNLVWTNCN